MFLNDGTVEGTASDVIGFKMSAITRGYYEDKYLPLFSSDILYGTHLSHQNFGSYIRTVTFEKIVEKFHSLYGDESQVVELGCGYDTLFWRLRDKGISFKKWTEIDKKIVVEKKAKILEDNEEFKPLDRYALKELDLELEDACDVIEKEIESDVPCLFIDEFSLIYVDRSSVKKIFETIGKHSKWCIASYSMTNLDDDYGEIIIEGFEEMGIPLKSVSLTPSVSETIKMLKECNFEAADASDAITYAKRSMSKEERMRVSRLDYYENPGELDFILKHYLFFAAGAKEFVTNMFS